MRAAPPGLLPAAPRLLRVTTGAILVLAGLGLVVAGWFVRVPVLHDHRPFVFPVFAALCLLHAAMAWRFARRRRMARLLLLLGPLALGCGGWMETRLILLRAAVLAAPDEALAAAGRHLIVGYIRADDLAPLITRAEVAGIFVGRRNAAGRSTEELAAEIDALQDIRRRYGLPPLWIAADQEGGAVSSLSPPLPRPPALSSAVGRPAEARDAARRAAEDLSCLGVTLNLAPVVDRAPESGGRDGTTRIAARAIAADPQVVADIAVRACGAWAENGVHCTLKHFPGIGAAQGDTHRSRVTLPALDERDLLPFREVIRRASPWIMAGHATVESLDDRHPASASVPVLAVLRRGWGFDGPVITDDVSMRAFSRDLRANSVAAMRAGVDVLLVSFDPDLVYDVLDALMAARRGDPGMDAVLARSAGRMARFPAPAARCTRGRAPG